MRVRAHTHTQDKKFKGLFFRTGIEEEFRPLYLSQFEEYVEEDVASLKVSDIASAQNSSVPKCIIKHGSRSSVICY